MTVTIPAILFLVATLLAAAAAFGIGSAVRTRVPNFGWLAVAALCLALFLQSID